MGVRILSKKFDFLKGPGRVNNKCCRFHEVLERIRLLPRGSEDNKVRFRRSGGNCNGPIENCPNGTLKIRGQESQQQAVVEDIDDVGVDPYRSVVVYKAARETCPCL